MKLRTSMGALSEPNFRQFFLARTVNTVGSMMTPVSLAFAVLHIDNSALALSKVTAAEVAANVVFILFGGVVADRFPRRVVLQTAYVGSALVLAVLSVLLWTGTATVLLMMVLAASAGATTAFSMPATQGILPQLVGAEQLQQANALTSFVRNTASFAGPVLGTLLVVTVGPAWAFAIDAVTFAFASALLLRVALPAAVAHEKTSIITELRDGWGEFRSRTWLWVIVVAFGVLNMIHGGAWIVLGPLTAKSEPSLGIRGWGFVLGAEAVGMLAMSVLLIRWHLGRPLVAGMLGAALLGVTIGLLGAHPVTVPMMVAAFASGAGLEVFGTAWNVALMEGVPQDVLSRVSSYDMLGSFVAIPLGTLAYGVLATAVPRPLLLEISGVLYLVLAAATVLVPSIRGFRRPRASVEAQTTP